MDEKYEKARKRVEEFSWDNYGKKLVKIYRNILNKRKQHFN